MKEVLLLCFANLESILVSVALIMIVNEIAGVARYRSKDYEGAMTDLEACVLIDPSNKFAYNYLVSVYFRDEC